MAKTYIVKSAAAVSYMENGSQRIQYAGEPFNTDGLRDGEVDRLVTMQAITEEGAGTPADPPTGDEKPAGNASHDEWVAYAVSQGVDQDEAEAKSRDELRDLFK
jgi:hypothetical protein